MEMTAEVLRDCCKQNDLYRTPELNDKLYLNFKGFHTIENLEPYTGLRALFLEGNALDSMVGIPPIKELRCLFVQQNMIWEIDGLQGLDNLDTLNISDNNICRLQNLSHLKSLRTLLCSNNRLATVESLSHLSECSELSVVDLTNNRIEGTLEELLPILQAMPKLRCLYLKGNPIVSHTKQYRKRLISSLPELTYLDDRPVFELERRCSEGWASGGLEGEREARQKFRDEEAEVDRRNFEYIKAVRAEAFRKRRERMGLPPGDTDPFFDDLSDGEWEELEEPPELVEARQRLAEFTARDGEEEPPELSQARTCLAREGVPIKPTSRAPAGESDLEDAPPGADPAGGLDSAPSSTPSAPGLRPALDGEASLAPGEQREAARPSSGSPVPQDTMAGHKVHYVYSEGTAPPAANGTLNTPSALEELD